MTWRLLDTGVRTAAENMALDRTVLLARSRNLVPDTIRFLQFSPTAVLVGYHQCVNQEIREEFCRDAGFHINRRLTGGGALFFNEAQLGWELIASSKTIPLSPNMIPLYRKMCSAVVRALKKFGLEAEFRPRNDIEVQGRKISGTGGSQEGDAFLFQGTLLLDFDIPTMLKALMIPVEKIQGKGINSVAERITWIRRELGTIPPLADIKSAIAAGFEEVFGMRLIPYGLTPEEEHIFEQELPYFGSDAWINRIDTRRTKVETYTAIHKADSGLIRAAVRVDERRHRLTSVMITGDFFIYPPRVIYDLECCLRDVRSDTNAIQDIVRRLWDEKEPLTHDLESGDFASAVLKAVEKSRYKQLGFTPSEANKIFTVSGSLFDLLKIRVPLLLLPYCSKLIGCPFREKEGCVKCGKCTIGDAYILGEEAGMTVKSIMSFEHLMVELKKAKREGVPAFVGCCCKAFYQKHYNDFIEAGVPGILVDIENSTCYDLGKSQDAYAGTFKSQTDLNLDLLSRIIDLIHGKEDRTAPAHEEDAHTSRFV